MEDELYCYEKYRGCSVFVESWWDGEENDPAPTLCFSGEIVDEDGSVLLNIDSYSGEGCLDECKDYIDELCNEGLFS